MNDQQLTAIMVMDMTEIINSVADQLLKKLKDSGGFIETIVYGAGEPKWYPRQRENGGLLEAYDKTDATVAGTTITAEVGEHPDRMTSEPEAFIHGSEYWDITDIRSLLTEIITEGKSGPLFGNGFWRESRDFWQPLLDMLESGEVDIMIETEFTNRGIKFIKG
jgi:hypothetical protein